MLSPELLLKPQNITISLLFSRNSNGSKYLKEKNIKSLHSHPRQQKFRAMNGAHLASPIRGDLGYAHRPHLGSQIHCPIGNQIWGTLGKEGVCPNFTLYGWANLCSTIRATLGQRQIRQSPGLALNAHSGNDWGPIPVLAGRTAVQL